MNRTNLHFLWKLSARLSLHDMYTPAEDPLFLLPLLSPEDIRHLGQVILASNAAPKYEPIPSPEILRCIINDCKDMIDNPQAVKRMMRSNETEGAHLALQLFLSMTANTQFPGQDPRPKDKAGRLVALLETLPHQHSNKLSGEHARVLSKIELFLGTSITQLSLCFFAVMNWQSLAYIHSANALRSCVGSRLAFGDPQDHKLKIMNALFQNDHLLGPSLAFTPERLTRTLIKQPSWQGFDQQFRIFLGLFSATTTELRQNTSERPEFRLGWISNRLSPLERHPIVRLSKEDGAHEFIVPNVAHFLKSFSAAIDYALLTEFGSPYSQLRGALLELYVRCLVEDRLPRLIVIPETTYNKEERRGPDLTLIDRELGRIVLIEVKGRRILLTTRLNMTEEGLRENLADSHEALRKLPRKLADLYAGLPEYRAYQEAIDSTRGSPPIFVTILSEGVYSMGELAREMGTNPGDPLYNYPFPYCVIALDVFERGVEIANRTNEPLPSLLQTHWERSLRREYYNSGADSFDGRHIPESETFAGSFAPWSRNRD
ncbi:MAG TPA: hypothetical protein VH988_06160 [Thermoanaerobaculia bacterium]|nr:hypothetical protein [Thermoanaerobaculia bacterium]